MHELALASFEPEEGLALRIWIILWRWRLPLGAHNLRRLDGLWPLCKGKRDC